MHRPTNHFSVHLLILATLLTACTDAAHDPGPGARLEGRYVATVFTIATQDTTFDELADGVALSLTLTSPGVAAGTLLPPLVAPFQFAGSWDTAGGIMRFTLQPPTFLNQMPFRITVDQLQGELRLPEETLRVTLRR